MRVATFSIVVGNRACPCRCPFCVSRMTGFGELPEEAGSVNLQNLHTACMLAKAGQTTTVLLTGKGSPTLFPDQITSHLGSLQPYGFPFLELQTDSFALGHLAVCHPKQAGAIRRDHLVRWRELRLGTVALSVVSTDDAANARI